jgi:hypothetical protein
MLSAHIKFSLLQQQVILELCQEAISHCNLAQSTDMIKVLVAALMDYNDRVFTLDKDLPKLIAK